MVAAVEVTLEAVVETTAELVVVVAAFEPHDVVIILVVSFSCDSPLFLFDLI